MKKYITLLVAVAVTSSFAFAAERPERPDRSTLEEQIDLIGGILEGTELSDRKRAYLENRVAVMEIQSEFRAALKARMAEIEEDISKEKRHDIMKGLREEFKGALGELKVNRRESFEGRRLLRKKAGEDE